MSVPQAVLIPYFFANPVGGVCPCVHCQLFGAIERSLGIGRGVVVGEGLQTPPDALVGHQLCGGIVEELAMVDAFPPRWPAEQREGYKRGPLRKCPQNRHKSETAHQQG